MAGIKKVSIEDDILERLKKKYKQQKFEVYSERTTDDSFTRLRTGSLGLDYITGGGWVYGGINYLYGSESAGKSTACIQAMVQAQKKGEICVFIDLEYSFDIRYAKRLGVNPDLLYLITPDTYEQALGVAIEFMQSKSVGVVILDSVASGLLEKQLSGEVTDTLIGVKAGINSRSIPYLANLAKKNNICLMLVNQTRMKIGVMFGNPETEPGGEVLRFAPSIKVHVRKSVAKANVVEVDGEIVGNLVTAHCTKNKTAPPLKKCEYNIIYGRGIDNIGEILTYGIKLGIIEKKGNTHLYQGTNFGVGVSKALDGLYENPDMCSLIEEAIYEEISDPYRDDIRLDDDIVADSLIIAVDE